MRLRWPFVSSHRKQELQEEIEAHLQMSVADHVAAGESEDFARQSSLREFGSVPLIQDVAYETWGWTRLDHFSHDFRYAIRQLRRSPGFALSAISTLALGIGACVAIFSVAEAVLLRPLPYPKYQRIVRIWEQAPDGHRINVADPNFDDFRAANTTFSNMAEYNWATTSILGGNEPIRANVAAVSRGFFPTLRVQPFLGRGFIPQEQHFGASPAAVVSFGYWKQHLGSAEDLFKLHLTIEGTIYSVVGVMPEGYDFPEKAAVWIPRELEPELTSRTAHNYHAIGRIRDGVTVAQARANLDTIARRIRARYGSNVDLSDAAVVPLSEAMVGNVRPALLTLLGAVGLLLLVACTNVAGLLVARTSARRKELALRSALGSSRRRLAQQLLVEGLVLSFSAGGLGLLLGAVGIRLLPATLPANLPRQQGIAVNFSVLLFSLVLTALVAVSLGLFAALRAGGNDLLGSLTASARSHTGTQAGQRLRRGLVSIEIAITLVTLMGAGLLARSFLQLVSTSPGFSQKDLMVVQFSLPTTPQTGGPGSASVTRQVHEIDTLLDRLRAIPGIANLGLTGALPVAGGDDLSDGIFIILDGHKPPTNFDEFGRMIENHSPTGEALYAIADQGYFQTLGIPLLHGRMFGEADGPNSTNVALISQTLARERWPHQSPIGQILEFGNMDGNLNPITVVGVVGDVRAQGLNAPPSPVIYVDYRQRGMDLNSSPSILLRATLPASSIIPAARSAFHQEVPNAPVAFSTFADEMGGWMADRRFLLFLVGSFAVITLIIAAVGIYGVVAYFVSRRTQEIGIRMAIGADRGDVLRLVLKEGVQMTALGILTGLFVSIFAARFLKSMLFGISAYDPMTFCAVSGLLFLVALTASYFPARRAMLVDPMTALRYE